MGRRRDPRPSGRVPGKLSGTQGAQITQLLAAVRDLEARVDRLEADSDESLTVSDAVAEVAVRLRDTMRSDR